MFKIRQNFSFGTLPLCPCRSLLHWARKLVDLFLPVLMRSGTPTLEGKRGSCPLSALFLGEVGEARIAIHIELFPFLLSCKGAFSGVADSLKGREFFWVHDKLLSIKYFIWEVARLFFAAW